MPKRVSMVALPMCGRTTHLGQNAQAIRQCIASIQKAAKVLTEAL